ncbi:unnamed protein product [Bathycoccus prasinos]
MIKRPTLFATSRRNFGNLLTHYETGQDGTTPDPDQTPDSVTFSTSWSTNGGIVEANLTSISLHRTAEVIVLTRDDGTVLVTLDENKVGDWDLQHDEESDYGSYDYKLLLSKWTTTTTSNPNIPPESYWVDTVIATHQQIFVRPEPTFTTSWTKSGLALSADLSSITNAHQDFYAYLCRDDETTLATHQFTEGQTTTSLSFTETEYGTFTYQLKLGTTVVSSHTETYVRPTPTYTASFSTNELTLTASTTSITNAHNSFAITLERDDGTVLQTHTLADGEASFTFTQTETSYATFNYIVKINGIQTDAYEATYTPPPYVQMRLRNNYTNPTFYVDRYNFDPTNDPLTIYYRHTIENVFQVGNVAQTYYNNITTLSQFQALGGVTQVNNVTSDWSQSMGVSSTSYANRTQQMTWFFIVHSSRSVAYRIAIWYYTSTNDTDARNANGRTGTYTNMNEIDL